MRYDIVSEADLDSAAMKLNTALIGTGTEQGQSTPTAAESGSPLKLVSPSKQAT
jgi:hypothetical protein